MIDFDQWEIVNDLVQSGGRVTAPLLWKTQNEHRIPFGRLACYADLKWFGGRNVSLLLECYALQLLTAGFFVWMIYKFRSLGGASFLTALGFILFCMFSPVQIANFIRGFQVTFLLCIFSATVSFGSLMLYWEWLHRQDRNRYGSSLLLTSLLCATIAELSLAGGLLVWPVLSLLSFALRLPRRTQFLVAAVGVTAIGAYFLDFHTSPGDRNSLITLQPLDLWRFVRTYLASTWGGMEIQQTWPPLLTLSHSKFSWFTLVESGTTIAVIAVLALGAMFLLRVKAHDKIFGFLLANCTFVIATASVTAVGRISSGIAQAGSIRYQSISLLFWASLAVMMLVSIHRRNDSLKLLAVQILILTLILSSFSRFNTYRHIASNRKQALAKAYRTLRQDPSDFEAFKVLYPATWMVPRWDSYLRVNGWGPKPDEVGAGNHWPEPTKESALTQRKVSGFVVAPASSCIGIFDSISPVPGEAGRIVARGWAWDYGRDKPSPSVIIVLDTGKVLGKAKVGLQRPDIPQNVRGITSSKTGWSLEVQAPKQGRLRAFSVLDHSKSVCPLTGP